MAVGGTGVGVTVGGIDVAVGSDVAVAVGMGGKGVGLEPLLGTVVGKMMGVAVDVDAGADVG